MTTPVQRPFDSYIADGVQTLFAYTFSRVEDMDIVVLVNTVAAPVTFVALTNFSDYLIQKQAEVGGEIVFTTAPASGVTVLIVRKTTITQNLDYITPDGFPTESHEAELDKITYILQELLGGAFGGIGADGNPIFITFDLAVVAGVVTVTVTNTGGTDAILPAWVSALTAGVFHAEITGSAPADEAVTTEADGHVWFEV